MQNRVNGCDHRWTRAIIRELIIYLKGEMQQLTGEIYKNRMAGRICILLLGVVNANTEEFAQVNTVT